MEKNFCITIEKTNKVAKAEATKAKDDAQTISGVSRFYCTSGVGHLDTTQAAQFVRAVSVASRLQFDEMAASVETLPNVETLPKVAKAIEAAEKAAAKVAPLAEKVAAAKLKLAEAETAKAEAETATAAAARTKLAAAQSAEATAKRNKLGRKDATAADVEATAKQAAEALAMWEKAKTAETKAANACTAAAETLKKATEAKQAAEGKAIEAEAAAETAKVYAVYDANGVQRLTTANAHESRFFRGWVVRQLRRYLPNVDGVCIGWETISDKTQPIQAADGAKVVLKLGAVAANVDDLPTWDEGRNFTYADVTTAETESGERKPTRPLYFRDPESGYLYKVTAKRDHEAASGYGVIIQVAAACAKFSPLVAFDVMRFALSADSAAEAKADAANKRAETLAAKKAADSLASQAAKDKQRADAANKAATLQESETAADFEAAAN